MSFSPLNHVQAGGRAGLTQETGTIAGNSPSSLANNELIRIFNTAVVTTQTQNVRDFTSELYALVRSPAYEAILASVKHLARAEGTSELDAAQDIIQTFRKLDQIWGGYLLREGIVRIKDQEPA